MYTDLFAFLFINIYRYVYMSVHLNVDTTWRIFGGFFWDCCLDVFVSVEENSIQREWKKNRCGEAWITWEFFDNIQNSYIIHCLYGF